MHKMRRMRRVGLVQLVIFLVIELTQLVSNPTFDVGVIFTANYFFSERRRPCRQRDALSDRLRESKIKLAQSFKYAHISNVWYMCL
jgi:hypothetical protein